MDLPGCSTERLKFYEKMAKRAPNFTQNEKDWLLHYVDKNKNVLECKKSDVNTNG